MQRSFKPWKWERYPPGEPISPEKQLCAALDFRASDVISTQPIDRHPRQPIQSGAWDARQITRSNLKPIKECGLSVRRRLTRECQTTYLPRTLRVTSLPFSQFQFQCETSPHRASNPTTLNGGKEVKGFNSSVSLHFTTHNLIHRPMDGPEMPVWQTSALIL